MSEPIRLSGVEISPPPVEPYRYGLFSAALERPGADGHWEIAGVQYLSNGCDPGGGIWRDPCFVQPLPGPTTEQAFLVTLSKAAGGNVLTATLTSRNAGYGATPVTVTIDGLSKTLATVGASDTWTVTPSVTIPVSANIASFGKYPPGSVADTFDVPATAAAGTDTLGASVSVPPDYPTKTLPLGDLDVITGLPFIVYESVSCGPGLGDEEARQRAQARLEMHEQFRVEQQFAADALAGTDVATPNGTTALPFEQALGLLEREIAARYGGLGIIHAARQLAAVAQSVGWLVERRGEPDTVRTVLDNVWAFGAGYGTASPLGVAAPAGQAWIYATGPVLLQRGPVQARTDFSTTRNIRLALAERSYVITADCPRLAVLADLPGSP